MNCFCVDHCRHFITAAHEATSSSFTLIHKENSHRAWRCELVTVTERVVIGFALFHTLGNSVPSAAMWWNVTFPETTSRILGQHLKRKNCAKQFQLSMGPGHSSRQHTALWCIAHGQHWKTRKLIQSIG